MMTPAWEVAEGTALTTGTGWGCPGASAPGTAAAVLRVLVWEAGTAETALTGAVAEVVVAGTAAAAVAAGAVAAACDVAAGTVAAVWAAALASGLV